VLALTTPGLVRQRDVAWTDGRKIRPHVPLAVDIHPWFLGDAIRRYADHPEHRAAIGTREEHERLTAALTGAAPHRLAREGATVELDGRHPVEELANSATLRRSSAGRNVEPLARTADQVHHMPRGVVSLSDRRDGCRCPPRCGANGHSA
jgi:hypothetical protein